MPIPFDRFRLLNGGRSIRNESDKPVYIKAEEPDPEVVLPPGEEMDLPFSPAGEVTITLPGDE